MNPINMVFGGVTGLGKGLVDGVESGWKRGGNGKFFDIITKPVGALAGAATGSVIGTSAGIATGASQKFNSNPLKAAETTINNLDETRLVQKVTNPNSKEAGGGGAATGGQYKAMNGWVDPRQQ